MTESGATCPPGLSLQQYNNIDHDVCGGPNPALGCLYSTTFSTLGLTILKCVNNSEDINITVQMHSTALVKV